MNYYQIKAFVKKIKYENGLRTAIGNDSANNILRSTTRTDSLEVSKRKSLYDDVLRIANFFNPYKKHKGF